MKRNLIAMSSKKYDILVIGGGINGVSVARDAALRGLSVALFEKKDFGHATSANTLGIIHGGLRYLQRLDIPRCLRNVREQIIFYKNSPHLVRPLPFIIPAYGHLQYGKEILYIGVLLYKFLKLYINYKYNIDLHEDLPLSFSKNECLKLIPFLDDQNLTGAVTYYDGQIQSPERLTLSIAKSADSAGADLANYAEIINIIKDNDKTIGLSIRDNISQEQMEVYGDYIVNTAGPWVNNIIGLFNINKNNNAVSYTKAFNIIFDGNLTGNAAIGIMGADSDLFYKRSRLPRKRYYFAVPSGKSTILGTEHLNNVSNPENFKITEEEISNFINKINISQKLISLSLNKIIKISGGLLPAYESVQDEYILFDRLEIIDHEKENNIRGIVTIIGTKYTESRYLAEKVINLLMHKMGRVRIATRTHITPVYGGEFAEDVISILDKLNDKYKGVGRSKLENLYCKYGSSIDEVMKYTSEEKIDDKNEDYLILKAEIIHAIEREMACNLEDIVLRRIPSFETAKPDQNYARKCARIMADYMGWSNHELSVELSRLGYT